AETLPSGRAAPAMHVLVSPNGSTKTRPVSPVRETKDDGFHEMDGSSGMSRGDWISVFMKSCPMVRQSHRYPFDLFTHSPDGKSVVRTTAGLQPPSAPPDSHNCFLTRPDSPSTCVQVSVFFPAAAREVPTGGA